MTGFHDDISQHSKTILSFKRPGTCVPGPSDTTQLTMLFTYGIRSRKKQAGTLIGKLFEKAPVPSNAPVVFVVQWIGDDKFVVVSQV